MSKPFQKSRKGFGKGSDTLRDFVPLCFKLMSHSTSLAILIRWSDTA